MQSPAAMATRATTWPKALSRSAPRRVPGPNQSPTTKRAWCIPVSPSAEEAHPISDPRPTATAGRVTAREGGERGGRRGAFACGGGAAHQVVGVEAAEDVPPSERGVEELADKAGDKNDAGEGTEGEGMDGARSRQQPRNENLVADARAKLVLEFAGVALVEGALVDARPPPRVEALYVHPSGSARTVAGPEKRVGGGVGRVKANAAAGLVVCHPVRLGPESESVGVARRAANSSFYLLPKSFRRPAWDVRFIYF